MTISPKSIKLLWSGAAGYCSFDGCHERLCQPEAEGAAPYTLGEMAHICGDKPGANRHDPSQTQEQRDDYANLILLCPNHHSVIDKKANEHRYSVQILEAMKREHEAKVIARMEAGKVPDRNSLALQIQALLEENYQAWVTYGPTSEIARKEPNNDAIHAVWTSERLSTIVPNNRKIAKLIGDHRNMFKSEEQAVVSAFLLHSRSYERWVNDEITYVAVRKFPQEFADLIRKIAYDSV
ncbi:HNH endonuclease [Rhizobium leguminosarum]|uniref:HNH endonuclease n=1 Tax=Rhizobium leguminosarum TaxID=384 RepID=UPI001C952B8E|nr:HNH endonuclease [Rhizobium leguminosarum]MBY5827670.1 HNH endonuclease [Rhizobium leguminosarum]